MSIDNSNGTNFNFAETKISDIQSPAEVKTNTISHLESPALPLSSISESPFHEFHSGANFGRLSHVSLIDPDTSMENSFNVSNIQDDIDSVYENGIKDPNIAIAEDDVVFYCGQIPKKQLGDAIEFKARTPKVTSNVPRPSSILKSNKRPVTEKRKVRVSFATSDKVLVTPMNPKAKTPARIYTAPAKSRSPLEKTIELPLLDRKPEEFKDEFDYAPSGLFDSDSEEDEDESSDEMPFVVSNVSNGVSPSMLHSILTRDQLENEESSSEEAQDDADASLISHIMNNSMNNGMNDDDDDQMEDNEEENQVEPQIINNSNTQMKSKVKNKSLPLHKINGEKSASGKRKNRHSLGFDVDLSNVNVNLTPTFARKPEPKQQNSIQTSNLKKFDLEPMKEDEADLVTPKSSLIFNSKCRSTGRIGTSKFIPFTENKQANTKRSRAKSAAVSNSEQSSTPNSSMPTPMALPSPKRGKHLFKPTNQHVSTPAQKLHETPLDDEAPPVSSSSNTPMDLFSTKTHSSKKKPRRSSTTFHASPFVNSTEEEEEEEDNNMEEEEDKNEQTNENSNSPRSPPSKKPCFTSIHFPDDSNNDANVDHVDTNEDVAVKSSNSFAFGSENNFSTANSRKSISFTRDISAFSSPFTKNKKRTRSMAFGTEMNTSNLYPDLSSFKQQQQQEEDKNETEQQTQTETIEQEINNDMETQQNSSPKVQIIDHASDTNNLSFGPNISCFSPIGIVPVMAEEKIDENDDEIMNDDDSNEFVNQTQSSSLVTPPVTPKSSNRFTQAVTNILCTPVRALSSKLFSTPSDEKISQECLISTWKSIRDYIRDENNDELNHILFETDRNLPASFITFKQMFNRIQENYYSSLNSFIKDFYNSIEIVQKHYPNLSKTLRSLRIFSDDIFNSLQVQLNDKNNKNPQENQSDNDEDEEMDTSFNPLDDETIPDFPEATDKFIADNYNFDDNNDDDHSGPPVATLSIFNENKEEDDTMIDDDETILDEKSTILTCDDDQGDKSSSSTPKLLKQFNVLIEDSRNVPCPSEDDFSEGDFYSAKSEFDNETPAVHAADIPVLVAASDNESEAEDKIQNVSFEHIEISNTSDRQCTPTNDNDDDLPAPMNKKRKSLQEQNVETKNETSEENYDDKEYLSYNLHQNIDNHETINEDSENMDKSFDFQLSEKNSNPDLSENIDMMDVSNNSFSIRDDSEKINLEDGDEDLSEVKDDHVLVDKRLADVSQVEESEDLSVEISLSSARHSIVSSNSNKENTVPIQLHIDSPTIERKESQNSSLDDAEEPMVMDDVKVVIEELSIHSEEPLQSKPDMEDDDDDEDSDSELDLELDISGLDLELSDEEEEDSEKFDSSSDKNQPKQPELEVVYAKKPSKKTQKKKVEPEPEPETPKVDYNSMTCVVLRKLLKERDLDTKGLKAALVKRLEDSDKSSNNNSVDEAEPSKEAEEEEEVEKEVVVPVKETKSKKSKKVSKTKKKEPTPPPSPEPVADEDSEDLDISLDISLSLELSDSEESANEEEVQNVAQNDDEESEENEEENAEEQKVDYNSMTCVVLRKLLKERDLDTKGLKAALIKRLEADDSKSNSKPVSKSAKSNTKTTATRNTTRKARR